MVIQPVEPYLESSFGVPVPDGKSIIIYLHLPGTCTTLLTIVAFSISIPIADTGSPTEKR